jgi:hypothetical protein
MLVCVVVPGSALVVAELGLLPLVESGLLLDASMVVPGSLLVVVESGLPLLVELGSPVAASVVRPGSVLVVAELASLVVSSSWQTSLLFTHWDLSLQQNPVE